MKVTIYFKDDTFPVILDNVLSTSETEGMFIVQQKNVTRRYPLSNIEHTAEEGKSARATRRQKRNQNTE